MTSPLPIRFTCQIDSLEEPISGRLEDGDGRFVAFRGWIEFAVAITDMAGEDSPSNAPTQGEVSTP
ncbi:MAG TPA: hypothetical protein VEX39_01375 [Thermoleophilaceae bacterium]|nr:hypothetical protein [Thermoleophilaceae bacterium]